MNETTTTTSATDQEESWRDYIAGLRKNPLEQTRHIERDQDE